MIKKLMKSTKLNEQEIKDIIFEDHLLRSYPKNYTKIELDFTLGSTNFIKKLSKKLKVNDDAILNHALKNYIKMKDNKQLKVDEKKK